MVSFPSLSWLGVHISAEEFFLLLIHLVFQPLDVLALCIYYFSIDVEINVRVDEAFASGKTTWSRETAGVCKTFFPIDVTDKVREFTIQIDLSAPVG